MKNMIHPLKELTDELLIENRTLKRMLSDVIEKSINPPVIHDNERAYYSKKDLAIIFGINVSTVDAWIMAGLPVLRRGPRAKAYIRRIDAELFMSELYPKKQWLHP